VIVLGLEGTNLDLGGKVDNTEGVEDRVIHVAIKGCIGENYHRG